MVCDHDCLHCKYPDCITDEMTDEEILESDRRDKAVKWERSWNAPKANNENVRIWQKNNPDKVRAAQARYRAKNKEVLAAKARERRKKKNPPAGVEDRQEDR